MSRLAAANSLWAIGDQVVVSAGNFGTTILLARGLPPAAFGTFVLMNSACLILNGFHANLIISPLVILGAPAGVAKSRSILTTALLLTLTLAPFSALVIFGAALPLHTAATGLFALCYVLAWQLQETTRRALLSRLRYGTAIWGDAVSYPGQALCLALLSLHHRADLTATFAIMAATSLLAAGLQYRQARIAIAVKTQFRETATEFWRLGRWLLLSAITGVVVVPMLPWLLNWFHGREAAATFQAVTNLLGFANPFVLSISAIATPAAATFMLRRHTSSAESLSSLAMRYVVQFELILAPWLLFLTLWPHAALVCLYGRFSPYSSETTALRVGVLVYVLTVPATVFAAVLTGCGKTRSNAAMQGAGALASLLCAPVLALIAGVSGALLATTISLGVRVLLAFRMLGRPAPALPVEATQPN